MSNLAYKYDHILDPVEFYELVRHRKTMSAYDRKRNQLQKLFIVTFSMLVLATITFGGLRQSTQYYEYQTQNIKSSNHDLKITVDDEISKTLAKENQILYNRDIAHKLSLTNPQTLKFLKVYPTECIQPSIENLTQRFYPSVANRTIRRSGLAINLISPPSLKTGE